MKGKIPRRSISPDRQFQIHDMEAVIRASAVDRHGSDFAVSRSQSTCNLLKGLPLTESVIKMAKEQSRDVRQKSRVSEGKSAEKRRNKEESSDRQSSKSIPLLSSTQDFPTWHKKSKFSNGQEEDNVVSSQYSNLSACSDQPLDLSRKPKRKKEKVKCEPKDSSLKGCASVEMTDVSSSLQSLQQKFGGDFPFRSSRRPRIGLTEQYYMSHLHVSPSLFSGWRKPTPRIQLKEAPLSDHSELKNGHSSEEQITSNEASVKTENSARNSQTVNAILTKISGSSESEKQDTCTNKHTTHRCSCQKTYPTLYELSIHLQESGHSPGIGKQTNLMEYPKLVRGQDMWLNQGSEQTKQILRCIQCGESFKSLPELTVHMMETQHYTKIVSTEHGRRAHKCSAYCERESTDSECVFKCKICHKVFPDMEALANHMVISGHHRKHSGVGDSAASRHCRKRVLEDSPVTLNKTATADNKGTLLLARFCGETDQENYRTKSPSHKHVKTEVSHHDKKIACENCGEKIEMELFVEHIRYCLRKRVEEIHHLRLSKLNSSCAEERKLKLNAGSLKDLSSPKCKRTLCDKEAESVSVCSRGKLPNKHRKLNSSSCWISSNGETKHLNKEDFKSTAKLQPVRSPDIPKVKYPESKSQSAPSSPCNLVICELSPKSTLPNSSNVKSPYQSSRSPSPQLSSQSLTLCCSSSHSPSDRPKSLEQKGDCFGKDCTSQHEGKDNFTIKGCSNRKSPLTLNNSLPRTKSPIIDPRCETVSSPDESRSRSQSPISLKRSAFAKPRINGFASDSSRSPSPSSKNVDDQLLDYKQQTDVVGQSAKQGSGVQPAQQVTVKKEPPSCESSSKIRVRSGDSGSMVKTFDDSSPSAIEQMILEYSNNSIPDTGSHLKKLRDMKLPTCDNPSRGFHKSVSGHHHSESHNDQKSRDSPTSAQPLDIIDPDSSDTSSPATNALKAMENLIQKSFESKNEKSPNKVCPLDMLRQPLYGWFYQREMYNKAYPASQILKKDTALLSTNMTNIKEKAKTNENGHSTRSQLNGLDTCNNNNKSVITEHRSSESNGNRKPEDASVKRESVVCKYLNFFDDSSSENGKKKSSALDSLSSFVYGQPLTSEHPLDSLQRLISKAETPHENFANHCKNTVSTPEPAQDSSSPDMEDIPLNLTLKCQAIKSEQNCLSVSQNTDTDQKSDDSPLGNSDGESMEYKCPACNRHFATKGSYRYHLSRCHLSTVKKYGISTAFHMSPYIYLPLDHTAKFTKYYEMAQELAGKELTNEEEEK